MPTKPEKVAHVKAAGQTRTHHCHGGCGKQCPPAMWGCKACWFSLPKYIRDEIWATYRPNQENDLQPSEAYLVAAEKAQDFLRRKRQSVAI